MCDLSTPREASGRTLGTFTLRELECFRLVRVVNFTLSRKEAGLVACFVGLCAMGDG